MPEAFYFGTTSQKVFAIYDAPAGGAGQVLTVICPPLFFDHKRTQMALRALSVALAANGQHVIRFDYRGTGDSSGELELVTVSDWIEDVANAVREGCEIAAPNVVRIVGVRAGALLACKSMGASAVVQRIVLWDPVTDGADYVQALQRVQKEICERNLYLPRAERRKAMHELAGSAISDHLLDQLRSLDSSVYAGVPVENLHVLCTSSEPTFPVQAVQRDLIPFGCRWDTVADGQVVPRPVLERLIESLVRS